MSDIRIPPAADESFIKPLMLPHRDPDEGPCGYTLRLADENSVSPLDILSLMGGMRLGFVGIDRRNLKIHQIKEMLAGPARLCPNCIAGLRRSAATWELPMADACLNCGTWLVDTCSTCHQHLTWLRPSLLRCKCGASVCEEPASKAPDAVVELAKSLASISDRQPPSLAALQTAHLSGAVKAAQFLGSLASGLPEARKLNDLKLDLLNRSWVLSSAAAEVLIGWPESFWKLLDLKRSQLIEGHRGSLLKSFSSVYLALYQRRYSQELEFIRSAFDAYVLQRWPGQVAKRNRRLQVHEAFNPMWIRLRPAAKLSGRTERSLKRLVDSGEISAQSWKTGTGRSFLMILRSDLDRLMSEKGPVINLLEAARLLGLPEVRAAQFLILYPGVISPEVHGEKWAIPRQLVDSILGILEGIPSPVDVASGALTLGDAMRYFLPDTNALQKLLAAVRGGDLPIIGRWPKLVGLSSIVFERAVLERWLQHERAVVQSFTLPAVATRFNVKQEVVYFLARSGLLQTMLVKVGRRLERHTSLMWIVDFERDYFFPQRLAKQLGTSARGIRDFLIGQSILPVAGPGVNNCRQLIFRKEPALAVLKANGIWADTASESVDLNRDRA